METNMRYAERLESLGYHPLFEEDVNFIDFNKEFSGKGIVLPKDYLDFLSQNPNTGVFDSIVTFKSDEPSPWANHGIDQISVLYGNTKSETNNIFNVNITYKNQLPSDFFAIGGDPAGNLIGFLLSHEQHGVVYFWDHESFGDVETGVYRIANSFSDFISRLQIEQNSQEDESTHKPRLISQTDYTQEFIDRMNALISKETE
jgi:hypothetical protein